MDETNEAYIVQIDKTYSAIKNQVHGLEVRVAVIAICSVLEDIFDLHEGDQRTKLINRVIEHLEEFKEKGNKNESVNDCV